MNLLLLATLCACQGGPPPAAGGAPSPEGGRPGAGDPARLTWISPRGEVEARLVGWGPDGPVLDERFTPRDWLALDFGRAPRAAGGDWVLELVDGARLPGRPGPRVLELPGWTLDGLAGVAPMPFDTLWLDGLGRPHIPPRLADEDQLWTAAGDGQVDRRRGFLLDWDEEGLSFEDVAGARRVPWTEVRGLRVLAEEVAPQADAVWIQLVNGGTLSARVVALDDDRLLLELPWGAGWNLPLDAVMRIRRRAGVVELAAPPADGGLGWEVVASPQGEVVDWSPKRARSVEGRPLRIGGATFPQGVGVHAPAELARPLDGPGLLYAEVGLDDEVRHFRGPQPVVFEVWLDQELLHRSPPHSSGQGPRALLVPVPQAGRLRLRALPAGRSEVGAHADWAELLWLPLPGGG